MSLTRRPSYQRASVPVGGDVGVKVDYCGSSWQLQHRLSQTFLSCRPQEGFKNALAVQINKLSCGKTARASFSGHIITVWETCIHTHMHEHTENKHSRH